MERASDRKSCFHCTWNRDAVWKISEDHDLSLIHIFLLDEYQDSNLVQEILMQTVSGWVNERKNIFMVGDVKQSIYRCV